MQIASLPWYERCQGPAVFRRWGLVLLTASLLPAFSLHLAGCATRSVPPTLTSETAGYTASSDSLGLSDFLALPADLQQERRRLAAQWLDRASRAGRKDIEIRDLGRAAGLAPDNPDTWLRLAHILRWIGDYVRTSEALDNAAAAVRKLDSSHSKQEIRDAQRRTALARAWLHYDRGEYREAMRWVRAGDEISPGDIWIRQIRGLVDASLNNRSQAHEIAGDMRRGKTNDPDARWVLAALDRAQGRYREAFNYIAPVRPDHLHSAECYRDKGEIAEQLSEWSYARRWYQESASALPFADTSCLTEITYSRLEPGSAASHLPFWLAFDRYYITGSLSAYASLALHRFHTASDPAEKEFWAGQVVNAAGILLRKDLHPAWSLRARGLVFAEKDQSGRGLKDLRRAARMLASEGQQDARVEAAIGRLLLKDEDHEQAAVHLRAAVRLDPDLARAWSDLGLCQIMDEDTEGAALSLSRAIALDANLAAAWYNRGLMNLHAGNLDEAQADLDQALRLAPGNQEITRLLQQVHLRRMQD